MKNRIQQHVGVLASILLVPTFFTIDVAADSGQSLISQGINLIKSGEGYSKLEASDLYDQPKVNNQSLENCGNGITVLAPSEPTFEGVFNKPFVQESGPKQTSLGEEPIWSQRFSKKLSGWFSSSATKAKSLAESFTVKAKPLVESFAAKAKSLAGSARDFLYNGLINHVVPGTKSMTSSLGKGVTNYAIPGAVKAVEIAGKGLSDVAQHFSPEIIHESYTRAYADTVAYQQQGYEPLSSFALVTLLHPACWFGNQIFSEDTKGTSYINLHNWANLCKMGAIKGAKIVAETSYEAERENFLVPVLGGLVVTGGGLTGWGVLSAAAYLGNKISELGVYLPTPLPQQPQEALVN